MPTKLPFDEPTDPADHTQDGAADDFLPTSETTRPARLFARVTSSPLSDVFQSPSTDATQPLVPVDLGSVNDALEEATSPGLLPVPRTGAEAVGEKRGDIGQLLMSVGPFLWSLEAAVKWIEAHSAGDPAAEAHARSLGLFARVLGQLQLRIDEIAPRR